ncbi:MAG: DUF547 domain-containing protein [Litoreibacter sp.]|uniref:DUF547 domain-containing protein n=1 Tax=Litoreibacter sp. TaxID=1969459 RepID=UPI003297148D
MLRPLIIATLAVSLGACASVERLALPQPTLLSEDFAFQTPRKTERVNYAVYNQFLAKYWTKDANGIARLDYKAVGATDQANLASFINQLQQRDPSNLTRDDQLAYWINLYNAQTIRVVLDAYPVTSIRKIKDGPFSIGPWNRKDVVVNGTALSLNDIEHRIIRPTFNEPRIHYALNCAAASCPNLAPQAWQGSGLDAAFEVAELSYLADDRGISIGDDGRVQASKIYSWFREDFGATENEVLARLISKSPAPKAAALRARGRIDGYDYDWSLNEVQ